MRLLSRALLLLVIAATTPATGQVAMDSLWGVWNDTVRPPLDRLRAMSYISIDGYLHAGKPDSGYLLARRQYELAGRSANQRYQAVALTTQGEFHLMRGGYKAALEAFERAMTLFAPDSSAMIMAAGNMGVVYQEIGELGKALGIYERVRTIATRLADTVRMANAEINMGTMLLSLHDTARAMDAFARCIRLLPRGTDDRGLGMALGNMAMLQSIQHREKQADSTYRAYLRMAEELGDDELILHACMNLAAHTLRYQRYGEAIRHGRRALRIAREAELYEEIGTVSHALAEALHRSGQYAEVFDLMSLHDSMQDSLKKEEAAAEVRRNDLRHAYERQALADSLSFAGELAKAEDRRTIAELRAQRNRNRTWAAAAGGILLLGGLAAWSWTDRRRRQERFAKESARLETQALRSQMNPHFIFNALNSISAFVQGNDPDRATSFLSKFARVMRAVLENSRLNEVPLKDDLEALKGYMELERMRMDGRFEVRIHVDPSIDPEEVLVPPLVVQPFVENAIWHGMAGKGSGGLITLRVDRRGERLLYTVEDNGMGRTARRETQAADPPAKKTSLGTAITRARLDLVARHHGGHAGFRTIDLPQGTRVELELPLLTA